MVPYFLLGQFILSYLADFYSFFPFLPAPCFHTLAYSCLPQVEVLRGAETSLESSRENLGILELSDLEEAGRARYVCMP